jgi:hypothetical protein
VSDNDHVYHCVFPVAVIVIYQYMLCICSVYICMYIYVDMTRFLYTKDTTLTFNCNHLCFSNFRPYIILFSQVLTSQTFATSKTPLKAPARANQLNLPVIMGCPEFGQAKWPSNDHQEWECDCEPFSPVISYMFTH